MSWIREMSLRGLDPNDVVDANEPLYFVIPNNARFLKGCVIGDPCACTAAKAVLALPDTCFAWIGAKMAVVAFLDGSAFRYQHNGVIPKTQDQLIMPPPGKYSLRPPEPSSMLGASRKPVVRDGSRPHLKGKRRKPVLSAAGLMRR